MSEATFQMLVYAVCGAWLTSVLFHCVIIAWRLRHIHADCKWYDKQIRDAERRAFGDGLTDP